MADSSAIRAGRAFVELFAKDGISKTLKDTQKRFKAWGEGIAAIGRKAFIASSLIGAPFLAAAKAFNDIGSQIDDMSQRTGASAEALSGLAFAAKLSGTDIEALENSLRKMQKFMVEAGNGSKQASDLVDRLGISLKQLKGLSPDRQLALIGDRISKIPDPAKRAAVAMQIFGKTGTALLPMFAQGAGGLKGLLDQAEKLGLVLKTEDVQAAAAFGDTLDTLWAVIRRGAFAIGAALNPALSSAAKWLTKTIVSVTKWADKNRAFVVGAAKLVAIVFAVSAGLIGLGAILSTIAPLFGAAASSIIALGTIASGAFSVISAAAGFLLTPVGAVIAILAGVGAAALYMSGLIGQATAVGKAALAELFTDALDTYQGIANALAAGDLALAAKILWLSIQMEWQRGIGVINGLWLEWKTFFQNVVTEAVANIAIALTDGWAAIEVAFEESLAFLAQAWYSFLGAFRKGWSNAQGFIARGVLNLMNLFGELSNEELDDAIKDSDAETEKRNREIAADSGFAKDVIEKRRKKRRDEIESNRQGAGEIIRGDADRLEQERLDAVDAAKKRSQEALNAARKEFDDAMNAAERARARMPEENEAAAGAKRHFQDVPDVEASHVTGSFSAFGLAGLGTGSAANRTADATEQTAENTKRILKKPAGAFS